MAIGGSLGRNSDDMFALLNSLLSSSAVPPSLPIHLLGIADPSNVEHCVRYGIDTFDSWYDFILHP